MKQPTVLLITCCLAQLIVVLDSSILTVALPHIATDLSFSSAHLPWVINAFAIPVAGLLLLSGKLSDRYGARPILLTGTVILAGGSLLGGLAPDAAILICARISQGIGAALMSPATLSLLSTHFPGGPARTRAFGLWGAASGSGGAIGVLAGGVLVESATWRWALLVNVPLTLALIALTLTLVTAHDVARDGRLDVAGATTGTITVTAVVLVFATIEASLFGVGPALWAVIALSALSLFNMIETRWSADPLIPLRQLHAQKVWFLPAAMFLVGGTMTATFYFLTRYFQMDQGFTPLQTGLAFLPMSVAAFIAAANCQLLTQKLGTARTAATSIVVMTIALGALAGLVGPPQTSLTISISSTIFGVGMGIAISTIADLVTASFPTRLSGLASGVLATAQQTGNTIELAGLVAIDLNAPSTTHGTAFGAAALMALTAAFLAYKYARQTKSQLLHEPADDPSPGAR